MEAWKVWLSETNYLTKRMAENMRSKRRKLAIGVVVVVVSLLYMSHMFSGHVVTYGGPDPVVRCVVAPPNNDSHTWSMSSSLPEVASHASGSDTKKILLVSYGRSGSTFTSYILSQVPGAVFFFEPLRPHVMRTTRGLDVIMSYKAIGATYADPKQLNKSELSQYELGALDVLENLLNCNIHQLPVTDFLSVHLNHGDTKKLAACLTPMATDTYLNLPHYLKCLVDYWWLCKSSLLKVVKVIRLPLRSVFSLMRQYEDLKLVYLVRDPRATLLSQRTWFGHAPTAKDFCSMVSDDTAHMHIMQDTFPGRAVTIRYEDVADNPVEWTTRLYKALGLELTSSVLHGVQRLISSNEDWGPYSAFRSDPQLAANKWRTEIDSLSVRRTDHYCRGVYKVLGYRLGSEENILRNLSVPLTEPTHKLNTL